MSEETVPGSTDNVSLSAGLAVGARLGKYEIVERVGFGGESIVYKGYDSLLDRYVAIKQVSPQLAADEKFAERFRDIAKQLAKLACEQVVTIYELVEQEDGLLVVMEFVDGHTIESTLAGQPGPVEPKAVLQIIWRIAAGLASLHRAGIVHRDIKPGNLIVSEGLRVKITDFGVAAKIGVPASMKLGTTKYMAPELFAGDTVDARADIYSLGMIAYEMLLGRAKFNEVFHDVVRDPHSEALRWMKWHSAREQVAPPLAELNPNVPAALSAIVDKMLAKDPADRFSGMETLGREIRASFSARAAGRTAQRLPKRRKVSLAAASQAEQQVAAGGSGIMAAEEGDELTFAPVQTGEPLTAAVPKKPMSRTAKYVLAGCLAGAAVAGLVVYLIVDSSRNAETRRLAETAYNQAYSTYKDAARASSTSGKKDGYSDAAAKFTDVYRQFQRTQSGYALQANVMHFVCRAYLDALENDKDAVKDDTEKLNQLMTEVAKQSGMAKFRVQVKQELEQFNSFWTGVREFTDLMRQAKELEDQGKYDDAGNLIEQAKKQAEQAGLDDKIYLCQAMVKQLAMEKKLGEYIDTVKKGDDSLAKKDPNRARSWYLDALKTLELRKADITNEEYQQERKKTQAKIDLIDRDLKYNAAKAEGDKARQANVKMAAVAAYKQALLIRPDDPDNLGDRIKQFEHDYWLEQGMAAIKAGNTKEAKDALNKAKQAKDSREVEQALAHIQQLESYDALRQKGDRFYQQKEWKAALEAYAAAAQIQQAAELQTRMQECRFQLTYADALAARAQKQYDKAVALLMQAKGIKPTEGARLDAEAEAVRLEKNYNEKIDAARKALEGRRWGEARKLAEEAKKLRATTDADGLIKDSQYGEYFQRGKEAEEIGSKRTALGYYKVARDYKQTAQVEEIINRLQKELENEKPPE